MTTPKTIADELAEALELVLDTVDGCHDCWRLSASDEGTAKVHAALTKYREAK